MSFGRIDRVSYKCLGGVCMLIVFPAVEEVVGPSVIHIVNNGIIPEPFSHLG